jgi:cytidine deaminase
MKVYKVDNKTAEKMLKIAQEHLENTYPKKGHGYAVSVLTERGNIYLGVSYESDTYTLTMHSEAIALAHANLHGEKKIVAITGPNCHICKQLIYESSLRSGWDVVVIFKEGGKIKQIPISKMMPYPWPEKPQI